MAFTRSYKWLHGKTDGIFISHSNASCVENKLMKLHLFEEKKHQLVKATVFSLMISILTSEIKYIIGDKYSVPLFCKFVLLFYGLTEHRCRGQYFQNTYRLLENNLSVKNHFFLNIII